MNARHRTVLAALVAVGIAPWNLSLATDTLPATAVSKASEHVDLGTTVVTGNRELPKVLYIVPWKKSEVGDLPAQPFNTLLDEVLSPVDRDVFRREVRYFEALSRPAAPPSERRAAP
jgi:hypothetical protein